MNEGLENLINTVEMALFAQPPKTEAELRKFIKAMQPIVAPSLSEDDCEVIARQIEEKEGVRAGLGALLAAGDFEPWLDEAKPGIQPFYWDRYKKQLLRDGLPRDVITSTDEVTDRILGQLGNPKLAEKWDRRGMVVGHVQSGKTANYTGLVCKAADAGYRLIIIIAGIHNNLRNQTQGRIDEGFIGRDTGNLAAGRNRDRKIIGVGKFDPSNTPVSLTNTIKDFNKETATTNTSEIDSYKVPVVLVIKKNHRTLQNLLDWLRDNSAKGDSEMIDQPMLLIDDEADNASINTKYKQQLVTTINGQIRDLLGMFHRSCYVGYTATPFANIFIDPDQDDDMFDEDLFPRDFIIGLDAPSNYFGAKKIFVDGMPESEEATWLRFIHDNEDVLPIKHKIDHELDDLPGSLITAVRSFLVARTIRDLRGQYGSHCSMLVNASRFTRVQGLLRNRLHEVVERIQNSVRISASMGQRGLQDPELLALKDVWKQEYSEAGFDWGEVQSNLLKSVASAKVVEVNSKSNGLSYEISGDRGQTVIAVGGFSLSRGLTLEGLTTTWFLRNSMMYDTLMQMGRWFGYRIGYEDLCRIWMPREAIDWYSYIANASDELHQELKTMERAKATPRDFGLAVRSHPSSLLVTARNKLGSGQKVTAMIGLSNQFVETARVSLKTREANLACARRLLDALDEAGKGLDEAKPIATGFLAQNVNVDLVDQFLAGWRNAEESVQTDTGPIRAYIRARNEDELDKWDILVASVKKNEPSHVLGKPIGPAYRYIELGDLREGFMSFSGKRMRVASRGVEKVGVAAEKAANAEAEYLQEKGKTRDDKVNFPDSIYRSQRDRPLLVLHLVQPTPPKDEDDDPRAAQIPTEPYLAWSMSLPRSARPTEKVEYVVNTQRFREMFGEEEEDDDAQAED
ncbi:Z1 domain-containing protein [Falsiruegeria mediterranea]